MQTESVDTRMNIIDIMIIGVVVFSAILGLYWGIIRQVLSIVGLIAGIALASRYGATVAEWLSSFIGDSRVANVLGFVFVFIGVTTVASLLASLLHRFAGLLFLGWADHLIGGLLGFVQGALMAAVLVAVLAANQNEALSTALRSSQYAQRMIATFGIVLTLLPESIRTSAQIFFGGL